MKNPILAAVRSLQSLHRCVVHGWGVRRFNNLQYALMKTMKDITQNEGTENNSILLGIVDACKRELTLIKSGLECDKSRSSIVDGTPVENMFVPTLTSGSEPWVLTHLKFENRPRALRPRNL